MIIDFDKASYPGAFGWIDNIDNGEKSGITKDTPKIPGGDWLSIPDPGEW